jgi:hypothetical protein
MTRPQRDLLTHVAAVGRARVDGNQLRVARSLERMGLVEIIVGGSGVAFTYPWWWEAWITDAGREALG